MNRGKAVFLHHPLGNQDRILEVVTVPGGGGMNAISMFWPRASSPRSVDGPSASTSRALIRSPTLTSGRWFIAGVLIGALVLDQVVDIDTRIVFANFILRWPGQQIRPASTWSTTPPRRATAVYPPESVATTRSIPVPTKRLVDPERRHGLALHVRTHQGAVGVNRARGTAPWMQPPRQSGAATRP